MRTAPVRTVPVRSPSPTGGGGPPDTTAWLAAHLARVAAASRTSPHVPLLVAAESAAALAAEEMGHIGLPWSTDVHDELLTALLGRRPSLGGRPPRMQELAREVGLLLGTPHLNPDSQPDLLRALHRAGLPARTTRSRELSRHEHPALGPLLRYKELARLHSAHGWAWRDQWVRQGRFHPEYVPGGGGERALGDPRRRGPADPTGGATGRRRGSRLEAKVALLAAMYGGGAGSPALAALRRRFPRALALLEEAARAGEDGRIVRSVLGRTCPGTATRPLPRERERPRQPRDTERAAPAPSLRSERAHGLGLRALLTLSDLEFHALPFVKGLVALALD